MIDFPRTATIEDKPSGAFTATVVGLRDLGSGGARKAFASALADGGQDYAKRNDLKPCKLSERNVGLLLSGVPDKLIEETIPPNVDDFDLATDQGRQSYRKAQIRKATEDRKDLLRWLANRNGWMDHGQLFSKDGRPHALVGQPYQVPAEDIESIGNIARLWGLHAMISSHSWYFPGSTVLVQLSRRD